MWGLEMSLTNMLLYIPWQQSEDATKLQVKMEELKKQEEEFKKKEAELAKKERVRWGGVWGGVWGWMSLDVFVKVKILYQASSLFFIYLSEVWQDIKVNADRAD